MHTRATFVYPLRRNTSAEISEGFKELFTGREIRYVRSDNGPEFKGEEFQQVLKDMKARWIPSEPNDPFPVMTGQPVQCPACRNKHRAHTCQLGWCLKARCNCDNPSIEKDLTIDWAQSGGVQSGGVWQTSCARRRTNKEVLRHFAR